MNEHSSLSKVVVLIMLLGALSGVVSGAEPAARAESACETKLAGSGAFVYKTDPKTICGLKPSVATQDCLIELLNAAKGKLRNGDILTIYGYCNVDSSKEFRECFKKQLPSAFNAADYKPATKIGDACIRQEKLAFKSRPAASPKSQPQSKK